MTELHTSRLILREWKASDEPDLIRIAGQEHIEYWLPDWREYDKHAKGWIEWAQRLYKNENPIDPFTSWAITNKESGALIGQINVGKFDKLGEAEVGIGYFLDASHCGKGYMVEAVQVVTRHIFDVYGYDHIVATIQPENTPSRRVAEKTGFKYKKIIEFKDTDQPEILPFCYYRLERPADAQECFMEQIIGIREYPEWLDRAAEYFSSRWGIDKQFYLESMAASLTTNEPVPRWYLMLRKDEIIGCFGLIENDFMVSTDFCPWLCGLYVEPHERGRELGARLLAHGRKEAWDLGYDTIYLNTDHVGYYEKYGWRYKGEFPHQSGEDARVYEAVAIRKLEEMSAFFAARADTYDSHMLEDLGLDEFYEAISGCFDKPLGSLLDLGCGTGLELERLLARFPDMEITGVDLSAEMLEQLKEKYPGKHLKLLCGSYFDIDFGGDYDCALSTYSLHHFSEEQKLSLYRKLHAALNPGGRFVFGDYTVATAERQQELMEAEKLARKESGAVDDQFYHFDTPFTPEAETRLMLEAGFSSVKTVRQWENTSIIIAEK